MAAEIYTPSEWAGIVRRMVRAYILVHVVPGREREVASKLLERPEVKDVDILYGEYDLIVIVEVDNLSKLDEFVLDVLRKMPGVERTTTLVAMQ